MTIESCAFGTPIKATPAGTSTSLTLKHAKAVNLTSVGQLLKMHATMTLRKNTDAAPPASHTIDLRLIFDEGSPIKGVKDIDLPRMRRDDSPNADPLLGVKVKINDSYFLIGLTRAEADARHNLDEIATYSWFDFPLRPTASAPHKRRP